MRVSTRILAQHLEDLSGMRVEGKGRCRTQDSIFPSLMQRGDLLLSGLVIVGAQEEACAREAAVLLMTPSLAHD